MSDDASSPERRKFIRQISLAGAGVYLASRATASPEPPKLAADFQVPRRKFGRHDFTVSSLGLGGHALRNASDEEAARIVDAALAHGLNFFDNCWEYFDGKAEELMGKLLVGRRDRVFLMSKVCSNHDGGGAPRALEMLEDSLRRLRTDHLDLWQVHAVQSMAQVESAYAKGGTLEALVQARQQGKVRFLGFTGHSDPAVHLAMLGRGFVFDSCQMPVNPFDSHHGREFREKVMPELVKQGIAPLAMKMMGGIPGPLVNGGKMTAQEALDYALSTPVVTAISGITSLAYLEQNTRIAASFQPLSKDQVSALEQRFVNAVAADAGPRYHHPLYRDGRGILEG